MTIAPFALAALLLLAASFTGSDQFVVFGYTFLASMLALIGLCFGWKWLGWHTCRSARARWTNAVVGLICGAVFVSVSTTQWPLRLAYALSRPSLDAVAFSLKSGAKYSQPTRAGVFSIEKAEIRNGQICLWTDIDTTGFIRRPLNNSSSNFNSWSSLTLDDQWRYISED